MDAPLTISGKLVTGLVTVSWGKMRFDRWNRKQWTTPHFHRFKVPLKQTLLKVTLYLLALSLAVSIVMLRNSDHSVLDYWHTSESRYLAVWFMYSTVNSLTLCHLKRVTVNFLGDLYFTYTAIATLRRTKLLQGESLLKYF